MFLGWHESLGIIMSVVVGSLYNSKDRPSWFLVMVMSRKLILLL